MKLIIFGPPLAGKGTQAKLIAKNFNLPHISAGQLLRNSISSGTTMGLVIGDFMTAGKLVPDSIIMRLMELRLSEDDCSDGFILDGFPRTLNQAEEFHELHKIDLVINLKVGDEILIKRITGRRTCRECGAIYHIKSNPPKKKDVCDLCGKVLYTRSDDRTDVLQNRLKIYHDETKPLVYFYMSENVLINIEGDKDIDEIYKSIEPHLLKIEPLP